MGLRDTFTSEEALADIEPALQILSGGKGDDDIVGIGVGHIEVVVAVSTVLNHFSTARPGGLDGMALQHPVADIDDVYILFHDDVAGESAIEDPVAQPFLQRRGVGIVRFLQCPGIVVGQSRTDPSQGSIMDPSRQLNEGWGTPDLKTHVQAEPSLGLPGDLHDVLAAGHIDGDRFFAVGMLAGVYHGLQMLRVVVGRAGDENGIHLAGIGQFPEGIRALENQRSIDGSRSLLCVDLVQPVGIPIQLVREDICQGVDPRVRILEKPVTDTSGPATAANHAHLQGGVGRSPPHQTRVQDHEAGGRRGLFHKLAAMDLILVVCLALFFLHESLLLRPQPTAIPLPLNVTVMGSGF